MKLTGRCKDGFDKWLVKQPWYNDYYITNEEIVTSFCDLHKILPFEKLPDSLKYGVLVDYFDSVGVVTEVSPIQDITMSGSILQGYRVYLNGFKVSRTVLNRTQARTEAIKKANHLINEQLM